MSIEARDLVGQTRQHLAVALHLLAQFLDLSSCREDAARLDLRTAGHQMRPAKHIAVDRGDRRRRLVRERHGLLETLGHVGFGNHLENRGGVGTVDAQHVRHRHDAGRAKDVVRVIAVRARFDNDEAAASGVLLPDERQPRGRLIVPLDDDVLQQIAQARLDRALVAAVDLEIVGDRALLPDAAVGLHQHHPGRITEVRPAGGQLLERREPSLDCGQLLLAGANVSRALLVLAPRDGQLSAPLRQLRCDPLEGRLRLRLRVRGGRTIGIHFLALAPHIVLLDIQSRELFDHALVLRARCGPSRGARSSSRWTIGRAPLRISSTRDSSPSICDWASACSALADAITPPASSRVRSMSTAASRRDSRATRAGSRRASRSWISAAISVPRPSSVSIC